MMVESQLHTGTSGRVKMKNSAWDGMQECIISHKHTVESPRSRLLFLLALVAVENPRKSVNVLSQA